MNDQNTESETAIELSPEQAESPKLVDAFARLKAKLRERDLLLDTLRKENETTQSLKDELSLVKSDNAELRSSNLELLERLANERQVNHELSTKLLTPAEETKTEEPDPASEDVSSSPPALAAAPSFTDPDLE